MRSQVKKKCRQQGQAMPIGVALIMFTMLAGIVLHNNAQQVSEKTRLANAADSAVYSGLIWQTRALNFQSYTNRAMVANQVTMAQAVSLRSWTLYGKIAAENANTVLGNVPYVGAVTNAMSTVMDTAESLLSPITEALLSFVNAVNGILSQAQTAMYGATFVATPEIVRDVATKNDPDFTADTAFSVVGAGLNLRDWNSFTEKYKENDGAAMQQRADIINRSTDRFTNARDWEFFNNWFYLGPIIRIKMHKRGETRLVSTPKTEQVYQGDGEYTTRTVGTNWEWKGKDTLSLNTIIWRPFRSDKKIEAPIGWGQAYVNSEGSETIEDSCRTVTDENTGQTRKECDRWFSWNRSAEYMSDNNVRSLGGTESQEKMNSTFNGIRAYRDLADLGNQARDPRLVLKVEVESPIAKVSTSSRLGFSGTFSAPDYVAKDSMASISSGEVYFKKPMQPHFGNHVEYANLYNPFWDVRLIDTQDKDKLYALLLRNVPVLQGVAPAATRALSDYVQAAQTQISDIQNELSLIESTLTDPDLMSNYDSAYIAEQQARKAQLEAQIATIQQTVAQAGSTTAENLLGDAAFAQSAIADAQLLANTLDPQAMQQQIETYAQDQFESFADQAEEVIKEKIKEELENAVKNALMGAVQGATGVDIDQLQSDFEDTYNQVNDQVDTLVDGVENVEEEFNEILADAEAETQRVEAEFEAIKLNVSQTFEERKAELEQQASDTLNALNGEITALQDQLLDETLLPDVRLDLENQIADLQSQVEAAPGDSLLEQAQMLVDVVSENTTLYELDLDLAIELISMEGDIGENLEERLRVDCSGDSVAESEIPTDYETTDAQCDE